MTHPPACRCAAPKSPPGCPATRLLAQLPNVEAANGNVGVERLTTCLDALAAMGKKGATFGQVPRPARAPARPRGASVVAGPLSPVLLAGASLQVAVTSPWAFLSPEDRAELRPGYGHVMAERVASTFSPVVVKAPGPMLRSACALCGIGEVRVNAVKVLRTGGVEVAQRFEWRDVTVADVSTIGARVTEGYRKADLCLCRACAAATDSAGTVGRTAMERSLFTYMAATGNPDGNRAMVEGGEVPGLTSWASLAIAARAAGRTLAPNAERWGHVNVGPGRTR